MTSTKNVAAEIEVVVRASAEEKEEEMQRFRSIVRPL